VRGQSKQFIIGEFSSVEARIQRRISDGVHGIPPATRSCLTQNGTAVVAAQGTSRYRNPKHALLTLIQVQLPCLTHWALRQDEPIPIAPGSQQAAQI